MRDYTVGGPSSITAAQNGLVDAQCFKPIIDRELMKQLMGRSNGWATAHIASWFAALGFFGWLAHRSWGSWWAVPAFAVYGVLYGSMIDGLCTHGKAHLAEGFVDGTTIECPKHNGRFNALTGEPVASPVRVATTVYETRVNGDKIEFRKK